MQVFRPGALIAVYDVIVAPPLDEGALHATRAEAFRERADAAIGAPGTVRGTTAADGLEAGPVPTPLVAVTAKMYAVPFVRPVTVQVVPVVVQVLPDGLAVAA